MNRKLILGGAAAAALALLKAPIAAAQQAPVGPSAKPPTASSAPAPFLSIAKNGAAYTVVVRGDVDLYSAYKLKETVLKLIEAGARDLVIDLAGCGYIDSAGLGALIYCQSDLRKAGGALKLSACRIR